MVRAADHPVYGCSRSGKLHAAQHRAGIRDKFVRVLMLIGAHLLGWEGVAIGFLISVAVMASTRTIVGTSYLYPLVPWDWSKLRKLLFRTKK